MSDPKRTIDEAWRDAEAALPEGWGFSVTVNPYGPDHRLAEWRYEIRAWRREGFSAYERSSNLAAALQAIVQRFAAVRTPFPP